MKTFDAWLVERGLRSGETNFCDSIPDKVPEWILRVFLTSMFLQLKIDEKWLTDLV
jgi:hypothetical protein